MPPTTPPSSPDDESKKKYIRTYASDMENVKKAGIPDLKTPAPTPPPKKPVPVPPASPVKVLPPQPPPPKPTPPPPQSPPPAPKPAPATPPEPKTSPLKTYTDDFLQKIKESRASTATVLAAEEDAKTSEPSPQESSRWSTLTIVVGSVLLLFGATGLYIGYTFYLNKSEPVALIPTISAPIFVDEKEKITGDTPAAMLQAIQLSMTRTLASNSVRLLYTDIATTTGNSVFSALQFPAPGVLLRNIDASQSMAGIVNIGGTSSPFFILSVASYQDTFAGMLSWEATMPGDLSALFPPYPIPVSAMIAVATTTTATTTAKTGTKSKTKVATSTPPVPVPIPAFYDEVVSNHDVRVYRDVQGRSVLIYGYWDKSTLVIARDSASFTEILRRLATANTQ